MQAFQQNSSKKKLTGTDLEKLSEMKKLLIFHSALAPYRVDFFNALAEKYICHITFLSRNNRNQPFDQKSLLNGAKFTYSYLDKKIVINDRDINIGYIKEIQAHKPDIIIGGEYGLPLAIPYLYNIITSKKYKLYTICDDSIAIAEQCKGIRKMLRDYFVPRIDNLILTTTTIANWYTQHFHLKKKPVVFPIIQDERKYRAILKNSLSISSEYNKRFCLNGKVVFLYVGRLTDVKNLPYLINEYAKIASNRNHLIIVGEGELKDDLIKIATEKHIINHISFVGRYGSNELYAWYNCADALILPSLRERFGAVIPEALMAGCPVLCSTFAGAAGLVDNSNGKVIHVTTKGELSKAMDEIQANTTKSRELRPSLMPRTFNDYLMDFTGQVIG